MPFRFIWENCKEYVFAAFEWIKEKVTEKVNKIKEFIVVAFTLIKEYIINPINEAKEKAINKFQETKDKIAEKVEEIKDKVQNKFNEIKEKIIKPINDAKDKVTSNFDNLKTTVSSKIENIKNIVSNKFNSIKEKALEPVNKMKDKIVEVIDKIKEKFNNFTAKFKMPHFKINGTMNPADWISDHSTIPSLKVEWYAKGGIMNQPTVFGINPSTGRQMVGGEAGPEAIAPIDTLLNYVRMAVSEQNTVLADKLEKLIDILLSYFPQFKDLMNQPIIADDGTIIAHYGPKFNDEFKRIEDKERRGS